jgi:hypothetical protein
VRNVTPPPAFVGSSPIAQRGSHQPLVERPASGTAVSTARWTAGRANQRSKVSRVAASG